MAEIHANCFASEEEVSFCDENLGVVYASDASLVWEDLKERFDKVNRVRIYQLHRDIATLTQGIDIVSVYFMKLKELWAEYDAMAYAMIVEEESQRSDVDRNSLGLKAVAEGNDTTALWTAKHPPKLRYKSPNAFCDH
ncbi:uncharacterized protein LOC107013437 [Solanum pennellii]|uniref:Uncharacterized protein LOC107013437 n=1 Tax=Solanum pennellii TaxID=28526 RepID=A0ABM1GBT1_SOLPN|nr:uncharacterized protein LOC107013437 [Solanum pennellii]